MIERGRIYLTQVKGVQTAVRVVEIEQNFSSRQRGKWVVCRLDGGRRFHRTTRQLRPS